MNLTERLQKLRHPRCPGCGMSYDGIEPTCWRCTEERMRRTFIKECIMECNDDISDDVGVLAGRRDHLE
jgi:predicted amidophosphoribosyltransferase